MVKRRLFVVEDHPMMRETYRLLFEGEDGIEICGWAVSGEEALEKLPSSGADLVLVDVSLPGMNGLSLVERLRRTMPSLLLLILTAYDDPCYRRESFRIGADAFLVKGDADLLLAEVHQLLGQASSLRN